MKSIQSRVINVKFSPVRLGHTQIHKQKSNVSDEIHVIPPTIRTL